MIDVTLCGCSWAANYYDVPCILFAPPRRRRNLSLKQARWKIPLSGRHWRISYLIVNIKISRIKYPKQENVNFLHYLRAQIPQQRWCHVDECSQDNLPAR